MVGGHILFTDTTHLKANANKNKYTKEEVEVETCEYFDDLNKAVEEDRIEHGNKAAKGEGGEKETKENRKAQQLLNVDLCNVKISRKCSFILITERHLSK